jgi:hypothetical protein
MTYPLRARVFFTEFSLPKNVVYTVKNSAGAYLLNSLLDGHDKSLKVEKV